MITKYGFEPVTGITTHVVLMKHLPKIFPKCFINTLQTGDVVTICLCFRFRIASKS